MKRAKSISLHLLFFAAVGLIFARMAAAESPSSLTVNGEGAVFFPQAVLQSVAGGQLSASGVTALLGQIVTQCASLVLSHAPAAGTPFASVPGFAATAQCQVAKCFKQALLIDLLAQASSNPFAGGSSDSDRTAEVKATGLSLIAGLQSSPACTDGTDPVDPNLSALFQ